ncbi:C4-dicarboxylate ABC transporter permease [Thalassobaculum fulvum]|uniref:TRAP transporter large permease protein n=1 Tax=Thalassobaculum fulvum TaxID=1633335 RepID=A0A918XU72_9PROT|nr:TRAP transporter large permease [Thalassobaculum fulvum]GHD55921.1 C4-dicarboxylate ABC transporter permease [Thalassobaculum fulvum]
MESLILFAMVLGLLFLGVPIAISLGLASLTVIIFFSNDSLASIALKFYESSEHYTLLAIPFFILASAFMSTGGVARRIIRFAIATVGSFRGGLAMAGVFACMLFAALSGSSPATVVAIGTIAIAGMRQVGYSKEFAAGVICNAGTLGILIPPSIVMVVYAAATDVSVGRMFLAGVFPGLVAGLMLMVGIYIAARVKGLPAQPWAGFGEIRASLADAGWGLFLIVIIIGGIYGGVFTPTEAAAVAAVYAFVIALFVYRDMGPLQAEPWRRDGEGLGLAAGRNLWLIVTRFVPACFHRDTQKVLNDSVKTTVMLMFIIANALLFAHVLTTERIPQSITDWMLGAGFNWWTFLLAVNLLLLLGGQFMEPSGLLLIVAPVVFPIAVQLGVDPIHLGIIMVVNMEIGMITPPIGLNLFVTSGITGMSLVQVVRAAAPWVMILFLFLILVTYVPGLSTWLPTTLMGPEIVTTH